MTAVLHLITGDPGLALDAITGEIAAGDTVTVAVLHGRPAPALPPGVRVHRVPDSLSWPALLDEIFAADRVVAW